MPPKAAAPQDQPPESAAPAAAPIRVVAELTLVAAGGLIGALARAAITWAVPASSQGFALSTQITNLSGALALGLLLGSLEDSRPRPGLRAFLAVGLLGSFTTFSTLVGEGPPLAATPSSGLALVLLALAIGAGLLVFELGHRLGVGLTARRSAAGRARP